MLIFALMENLATPGTHSTVCTGVPQSDGSSWFERAGVPSTGWPRHPMSSARCRSVTNRIKLGRCALQSRPQQMVGVHPEIVRHRARTCDGRIGAPCGLLVALGLHQPTLTYSACMMRTRARLSRRNPRPRFAASSDSLRSCGSTRTRSRTLPPRCAALRRRTGSSPSACRSRSRRKTLKINLNQSVIYLEPTRQISSIN